MIETLKLEGELVGRWVSVGSGKTGFKIPGVTCARETEVIQFLIVIGLSAKVTPVDAVTVVLWLSDLVIPAYDSALIIINVLPIMTGTLVCRTVFASYLARLNEWHCFGKILTNDWLKSAIDFIRKLQCKTLHVWFLHHYLACHQDRRSYHHLDKKSLMLCWTTVFWNDNKPLMMTSFSLISLISS